ncbi:WD40 repeat domain-containing protein [Actinokineospora soli]|uniref:WD40 repeat domain-containing protein n=1 Tax=Actinokineospora soli TaxID=1048753 RepID=A0ABW2TPY8_9PSEU
MAVLTHNRGVYAVAISPDGRFVATAGAENTVLLWTSDGTPWGTLSGHHDAVESVQFTRGGLLSASRDGTVRFWDLDLERLARKVCDWATAPLTVAEWQRSAPGVEYNPPCP